MAITISKSTATPKTISGCNCVLGHAYQLTVEYGSRGRVGEVYLRSAGGDFVNLLTGLRRNVDSRDMYVEVDLEIIVKERK